LRKERQKALVVVLVPLLVSIVGTLATFSLRIPDPAFVLLLVLLSAAMAFFAALFVEAPPSAQLWATLFGVIISVIGVAVATAIMIPGIAPTLVLIVQMASFGGGILVVIRALESSFINSVH